MSEDFNLKEQVPENKKKFPKFNLSKNWKRLIPLVVIIIAVPVTIFLSKQTQDLEQHASALDSSVSALTNTLLTEGKMSTNVNSRGVSVESVDESSVQKGATTAQARKKVMLKLASENPEEFLLNALPNEVTKELSPLVRDSTEKQVKFTGKVSIIHYDDFKGKRDKYVYQIKQLDKDNKEIKTYTLHFVKALPDVQTDSLVNIEGYALDNELVVQGGGGGDGSVDTGFSVWKYNNSNPIGNQKILVIMFNFTNDASEPVSRNQLKSIFFDAPDSIDKYIRETSSDKAAVSVDYAGYYQVPFDNYDCNNYDQWSSAAEAIAFSKGIDINAYPRHIYVFPNKGNCWASAWASVGGVPSRSWMTNIDVAGIYEHEFGHNLGLGHANSLDCGSSTILYDENGIQSACNHHEYGDPTDVMGYGAWDNSFQFNGPHKEDLNWLDPSQIITVKDSGSFSLSSLESNTQTPKLLKISIPTSNEYYYVSLRSPVGMDANIGSGITKGLSIHMGHRTAALYDFGESVKILDNTPESTDNNNDMTNSSLSDGQTFSDTYNGISIKQISHANDQASLQIDIDKSICRRQVPDVSISPLSQVGSAGEQLTYTLNIKNNDTPQCASANFTYSLLASGPVNVNWQGEFDPQTITLNPGEEKNIAEKVRSSGDSVIGIYNIGTTVSSENIRHNAVVKSSYIVFGHLAEVYINPGEIKTLVGDSPIGISALAYDNNNQPITSGVKYEWSMSSTNSVGTLEKAEGIINRLTALRSGFGEVTVKGTFNGDSVIKTVPVEITAKLSPIPTATTNKTITLSPSADSYVNASAPNKNYGTLGYLDVNSNPSEVTFFKFNLANLAGKKIIKATLNLKVKDASNSTLSLKKGSAESWSETGINNGNRPSFVNVLSTFTAKPVNGTVQLVVTSPVNLKKGSNLTLGITSAGTDKAVFYSRDAAALNRPQLIIEYQ